MKLVQSVLILYSLGKIITSSVNLLINNSRAQDKANKVINNKDCLHLPDKVRIKNFLKLKIFFKLIINLKYQKNSRKNQRKLLNINNNNILS